MESSAEQDNQKPKGVFSTLLADGNWMLLKGEYQKAVDSYTAALTLKAGDRNCLVGRSKCYLKMGQHENALRDAEASLAGDPSYSEGLYQRAEALYYMGEFEYALLFYHKGRKLRPQIQEFRLGVQKAQEAIENSVGPSTVKLEVKGDLSFLEKDLDKTLPLTDIEHLMTTKKPKTPKNAKTTKLLLGDLYSDKMYLERLLKDEGLGKGQTRRGQRLQDVIKSGLTYIDTCTEFWNKEKPVSAQKRRPKQKKENSADNDGPAQFLLTSLQDIDADLASGKARASLKKAEEVLKKVQGWSEKELPDKKEALGNLHSSIGNALMELGNMDKALGHHQEDLELAKQCNLPEAMSRALDNIARIYTQTGQYERAIDVWEEKLPLVTADLEQTWLLHEIGRCHLELNHYDEARDYGIQSAAAADQTDDVKWKMNANVLVAQSELKRKNFDSSVAHFERALLHARAQEDESAMAAIQKALDETRLLHQ
ncbi:outer dynein arm-docking complex subunit 4 [Synchiropus splendidus]|uniref:outer dynein arm-docking complex subunit 4 n=1 Tax=Synchiropus splendidus TaxID=270530 RepID=UPI00237E29A7|nr:outer dynein arm-docking complex subunit 4 [Synchiropus splendidus]